MIKTGPLRQQSGIALMDVLVSLLLISVTLVGAFSASSAGIQELRFLTRTTTAIEATKEMANRISVNLKPETIEIYQMKTKQVLYHLQSCLEGCTQQDLARNDLFMWTQKVLDSIPGAKLKIVFANNTAVLGILWDEPRKDDAVTPLCPFSEVSSKQYCLAFEIVAKT